MRLARRGRAARRRSRSPLRRWPRSRARARPARDGAAPRLLPDLHEPPRHDRLREPARRAPLPGRARPGDLRRAAVRLGGALHHPGAHRGDAVPLPELLLDRALDEPRAAAAAALAASSAPRPLGVITCFFMGYALYVVFPAAPPRLVLVYEFTKNLRGYPVGFSNLSAAGLLAAAGGQPGRVPVAARGGLARGARLRLALRCGAWFWVLLPFVARACGPRRSTCATTTSSTSWRAGCSRRSAVWLAPARRRAGGRGGSGRSATSRPRGLRADAARAG